MKVAAFTLCNRLLQPIVTTSCTTGNRLYNWLVVVFTLCSMLRQLLCQLLLDRLHLTIGCTTALYNRCVPRPRHAIMTSLTSLPSAVAPFLFVFSGSTMHEDDDDDLFIAVTAAAAVAITIKRCRRRRPATSPAAVVTTVVRFSQHGVLKLVTQCDFCADVPVICVKPSRIRTETIQIP